MKSLTFFLIFFFMIGHLACEQCQDNVPESILIKEATTLNYKDGGASDDVRLEGEETVSWDDLIIRVGFEYDFVAVNNNSSGGLLYADCPEIGRKGTGTGVESLYIITLNDFNENFRANDTINSIVLLNEWYDPTDWNNQNETNKLDPIDTYLRNYQETLHTNPFEIHLTAPSVEGVALQKFRVVFTMKDKTVFSKDTDSVLLSNE